MKLPPGMSMAQLLRMQKRQKLNVASIAPLEDGDLPNHGHDTTISTKTILTDATALDLTFETKTVVTGVDFVNSTVTTEEITYVKDVVLNPAGELINFVTAVQGVI